MFEEDFMHHNTHYGYDYGYNYGADGLEAFAAVMGVIIIAIVIAGAISLLLYILNALGIMRLGKNRGLPNPWLIWIPVVGCYATGAIADDIVQRQTGNNSIFRYLLLGGSILNLLLAGSSTSALFGNILYTGDFSGALVAGGMLSFSARLVGLALYILKIIVLHRIFKAYRPWNATLWTVLCAIPFTAFLQSIFPFVIRNDQPAPASPGGPYGGGQPYSGGQPPYSGRQNPYGGEQNPYGGNQPPYGGGQSPYTGGQSPYESGQDSYGSSGYVPRPDPQSPPAAPPADTPASSDAAWQSYNSYTPDSPAPPEKPGDDNPSNL